MGFNIATESEKILVVDVLLMKVLTCIQDEKGVNEVVFNPDGGRGRVD